MKQKIIAFLFFLAGAGMLVGDFFLYKSTADFVARAQQAEGEVVELVAKSDSDGDTTYAPKFTFKTEDGQAYTVTSSTSSKPAGFAVGDKVKVLYDPADPTDAKINTFFRIWFGTLILGVLGAVFALAGFAGMIFAGRKPKTPPPAEAPPAEAADGKPQDWDGAVDDK